MHFLEIRGFATCTCIAQCITTFQVVHHRKALVKLYQCTKFRVAPSKFPESNSGGSSYEATEAGPHLSFWENGNYYFFSENEIKFVSPYMSVTIRIGTYIVYTFIPIYDPSRADPEAQTTSQRLSCRSILYISRTVPSKSWDVNWGLAGPRLTGSPPLNTVTEAPSGQHGSANDAMAVAVYGPLLRLEAFRPLGYYLAHMTRSDTNEKLMNKKTYQYFYVNQFLFQVHRHLVIQCYYKIIFSLAVATGALCAIRRKELENSNPRPAGVATRYETAMLLFKRKTTLVSGKCWVITPWKVKMFI